MQACHPTYAPGRLLSNINSTNQGAFAPGDLLYITVGESGVLRREDSEAAVSRCLLDSPGGVWPGWLVVCLCLCCFLYIVCVTTHIFPGPHSNPAAY
jgi:hypothetical protein